MIFCNGCSKAGTHILTSMCESIKRREIDGTVIKRHSESDFVIKSSASLEKVFALSNRYFVHSHISHSPQVELIFARHKHLLMVRNPRDLAVSWMRLRVRQELDLVESKDLLGNLILGGMFGRSIPSFYQDFLGWLEVGNIFIIKFEDFISKKLLLDDLAAYLGVDANKLSYEQILGRGPTYTGEKSNWRDWWDGDLDEIWKKSGGTEIESGLARFYGAEQFK